MLSLKPQEDCDRRIEPVIVNGLTTACMKNACSENRTRFVPACGSALRALQSSGFLARKRVPMANAAYLEAVIVSSDAQLLHIVTRSLHASGVEAKTFDD